MKPVEQNLVVLQNLMTYRDKMVVDRASYQARIKELQGLMGDALHDAVIDSTEEIMKVFSREIKSIDSGLKAKYQQKVVQGKPKMSVLNIIRAKLIESIFTVAKRGSPYEIRLAAQIVLVPASGSLSIIVANLFCYSFLPVKEKNNQSVDRPSQGAAIFFAVSDDLKQQVSKFQGTIFTIIYKVYILIYNPAPSS
jgi:hypothetical protein